MSVSPEPMCEMTSRSTGKPCQQPKRWLEESTESLVHEQMAVCQVHGRQLEREGWRFVRELNPVPGFERIAEVPA